MIFLYVCWTVIFSCFFPLCTFSAQASVHSDKFFDSERSKQVIITKYNAEQLESFQEFSGEIPDGIYESWWRNGQRKYKTFFFKGKENGTIHYWYKSGREQFTGGMKDGLLDGELTSWFENGNNRTKEVYANGEKVGVWMSWHENKKHSSLLTFISGEILKCSSWDSEGKAIYIGSKKKQCADVFNENYTMPMESEDPE